MPDDPSVCGRAYRLASRIVISNLRNDPHFSPFLGTALRIGFQAVQSTPILYRHGCVIGMLSTHFSKPHSLSKAAEAALDALSMRAADLLQKLDKSGLQTAS